MQSPLGSRVVARVARAAGAVVTVAAITVAATAAVVEAGPVFYKNT